MIDSRCPICRNHRTSAEHQRQRDKCAAAMRKEAMRLEDLNGKPEKKRIALTPFLQVFAANGRVKTTEFL